MQLSSPLQPWKRLSSKIIHQDTWVHLRADTCQTSSGVEITPYYVLELPDWVHMVVVNSKREILITKQYRHGSQTISYELPCGNQDPTDRTSEDAAHRELMEETGYTGNFQYIQKVSPNPANHSNWINVYLVTEPEKVYEPNHDPTEVTTYEFVPVEEVYQLITEGKFIQATHIASLHLALL